MKGATLEPVGFSLQSMSDKVIMKKGLDKIEN